MAIIIKTKALRQFIDLVKDKPSMNGWKIIPICGAGISSVEDINAAYAMGCGSVLVASAIAAGRNQSSRTALLGGEKPASRRKTRTESVR
jgi:hypothetical protein